MSDLTLEELNLQILATCLLINTQGKWHAFYSLSGHVGQADVRITSSDNDYQVYDPARWATKDATFTSTSRHQNEWLTEEARRHSLIDLLAWTQSHLSMEAAA
jgi:hypothetical protein